MIALEQEKICVIGLGYVGLPVALSFAKKLPTVGFDIRQKRIDELKQGHDDTAEVTTADLTGNNSGWRLPAPSPPNRRWC